MSIILIICTGFKSNLFSSIQLADELRDAGHVIYFAAPESSLPWIDDRDFDTIKIPRAHCNVFLGYSDRFKLGLPTLKSRKIRSGLAVEKVLQEGFVDVLSETQPDLVLSDCEHHSAILQTFASGIPIGLLSFMYLTPPGDSAPPLKSAIVPGLGWWGSSFAIRARWIAFHIKYKGRLFISALKYWGSDFATVYRTLANSLEIDLPQIATANSFQVPWSYRLPTLFLLSKEVNLPVEVYPGHTFAGPKILSERLDLNDDAECRNFVESTASHRIFATFGTVRRAPRTFFQKLAEVARKHPDWHFLATTTECEKLISMELPKNLTVVKWAPQLEMLELADCAIFHGGAGTLNECIATCTPMLVLPNGLDGKGNAARVAYHSIGKMGTFSDPVETIEKNILALLEEKFYRDNLCRINHQLGCYENVANDFVKGLVFDPLVPYANSESS